MYRLKSRRVPLGGWLILAAFILLLCILEQASNTNLLSNGITTQGVILSEGTDFCGRPSSSQLATGGANPSRCNSATSQATSIPATSASVSTAASMQPPGSRLRSSTIQMTQPRLRRSTRSRPAPRSFRSSSFSQA